MSEVVIPIEQWLTVTGYPHIEASTYGRIRTKDRKVKHNSGGYRSEKGVLKKSTIQKNGRLKTYFWVNGIRKSLWTHRLIALAFLGEPNGLEVNHIDGNKLNNKPENLEYVTRAENWDHAIKMGLKNTRDKTHLTKIKTSELSRLFEMLRIKKVKDVSNYFGVCSSTVRKIISKYGKEYDFKR